MDQVASGRRCALDPTHRSATHELHPRSGRSGMWPKYVDGPARAQSRKDFRLSLSETPYSWRTGANRVMLLPDGPRSLDCSSPACGVKRRSWFFASRSTCSGASRQTDRPSTTLIVCCLSGCLGWFRQRLRHWAVVCTECMARPRSASGFLRVSLDQSAVMYPAPEHSLWP